MCFGKQFTVGLTALLLLPAIVYGQGESDPGGPPESVRLRLGPLALAPEISVFNVGWDSNVFNQAIDSETTSDFTATFRPDIRSWFRLGRARFQGRSFFDFVYYQELATERSVDMSHQGRLELPLTRITPYVSGRWVRAKQRFGYEIDQRVRRQEDSQIAGVDIRLGKRTHVDLAARRSRLKYEGTEGLDERFIFDFSDYTARGFGVALRRDLTPLTTVAVQVDGRRDRFDQTPERDSKSLAISSGVEFKPSALTSGSAFVGWRRFELESAGQKPFQGLVTLIQLAYTLKGVTRFAVSAQRDLEYSAIQGQHAYLLAGVRPSVTHRLNEAWDLGAHAGRYRLSYGLFNLLEGSPDQVLEFGDGREVVTEYGGEVGYRLGSDTRIGFSMTRSHRESTVGFVREYDRTLAAMSLTYRF
jgi:hypothetical protein